MDNILLFFFTLFPHVVLWFREVASVLRHSVYHEQHVINAVGDTRNTNNMNAAGAAASFFAHRDFSGILIEALTRGDRASFFRYRVAPGIIAISR